MSSGAAAHSTLVLGRLISDERVRTLQQFTAALSSAVAMKDVARVLFEEGLDRFGASAIGIVWMMQPGRLELVYGHGLTITEFEQLDRAAKAGERLPIRDAILSRRSVWLESPEEIRERYPVLESLRTRRGEYGCAVVPLVVGEMCPGVIGFTFAQPRHLSDEERAFIDVMAQLSAQAFERARLFEAEQAARREAERVGRVQEHLMGVVGHDLRTPLGAVALSAQALLRRSDLTHDVRAVVERIAGSAARMSGLIRDLLDQTRARQGRGISVRMTEVDVGAIARQAVLELGASRDTARLSFEVAGDVRAVADPGRIAQIVSNLVGNALQHGSGAPVHVTVAGMGREVTLAVHNTGPPIPPELLPHVFEPFRRGSAPDELVDTGSIGLGLSIVKDIVDAHGGAVEVRSGESGTVFTVRLPRRAE